MTPSGGSPPEPSAPEASTGRLWDAPAGNIVDTLAPAWSRPYLRLARIDRPIGWWLLLLPCWWSSALAALAAGRAGPDPWHLALFLVGAVAMRGAGSTYNDILDRDLDAGVERTRNRPLPSGAVSVAGAALFLVAQASVGLVVLWQFERFALLVGLCSLVPVAVYPLMKRFTSFPQLVLGFAFAWGGLMGWAAAMGSLAWPAFLVYAAAITWTIGYDTIYAMQDLEDDEVVGIGSTARLFGARLVPAVAAFYAATVALLGPALLGVGAGAPGWIGLAAFAAHLAWQVSSIRPGDRARALRLFRSNRMAGLLLFAGLLLDGFV